MRRSADGTVTRSAIALAEVLVATAVTAMAASALLSSIASSLTTGEWLMRREIARGLGAQLLAEVAAKPLPDAAGSSPSNPYGPYYGGTGYCGGYGVSGRAAFCSIDEYDGWSSRPPQTRCGTPLGRESSQTCEDAANYQLGRESGGNANDLLLARFRRRVEVEPIERSNGVWSTATVDSRFRRVNVFVDFFDASERPTLLYSHERIVSHVPSE